MIVSEGRDLRLEGLKLFLVSMVVVGHCVQPFRYDNVVLGGIYGIIYSFHMPLFVILSGYFFKMENWKEEATKSLRLLETFVLVTLVFWIAGGMSYTWPLVRLGGCPSWYLLSLVFWRVVSNIMLRKMQLKHLLFISIILSILVFVLLNKGEGIFTAMRIVQFYPFFLLGYAIKHDLFDK